VFPVVLVVSSIAGMYTERSPRRTSEIHPLLPRMARSLRLVRQSNEQMLAVRGSLL
jgi:hypothetical protein